MALTAKQLEQLKQDMLAGDRLGYYQHLTSYGSKYGRLAAGVVNAETLSGATANIFLKTEAKAAGTPLSNSRLAQLSVSLMQADFAARKDGHELGWQEIKSYHNKVFSQYGLSDDAWTPNYILKSKLLSGDEKAALWDHLLGASLILGNANAYIQSVHYLFKAYGFDLESVASYNLKLELAGTKALVFDSNDYGNYTLTLAAGGRIMGGDASGNTLVGTSSDDVMMGFAGNDTLSAGAGNDRLYGGQGNDKLHGGAGKNLIDGGDGTDTTFFFSSLESAVFDYDGVNRLTIDGSSVSRVEYVQFSDRKVALEPKSIGTENSDVLFGTAKADDMTGADGKDFLFGGAGDDTMDGGYGLDVVHGGDGNDSIWGDSPTWYFGNTTDNDRLFGDAGNDRLYGNQGRDILNGGDGNDWMDGGPGADILTGGSGKDTFQTRTFSLTPEVDHFTDFSHAQGDKILVDSGYHGSNPTLKLYVDKVPSNATGEFLFYKSGSGKLYIHDSPILYEGEYALLAILDNTPKLYQADFGFG